MSAWRKCLQNRVFRGISERGMAFRGLTSLAVMCVFPPMAPAKEPVLAKGMAAAIAAQPVGEWYRLGQGLGRSRARFLEKKKGRVVFLGGSITWQNGWRVRTCEDLHRMFPDCAFDFINAGIGGTDSAYGAFRLEEDGFHRGAVDLLFLEFAVNDKTNKDRLRGMEGIIRRARTLNPGIDIVVQYFADTTNLAFLRKGEDGPVIADHERVARHYGLPVVHQAREVAGLVDAETIGWKDFATDSCHPTPDGHGLYAARLGRFLATAWAGPPGEPVAAPALPAPLDSRCFESGRFVPYAAARILHGWEPHPGWKAEKAANFDGRADVLEALRPGAELELDFEGSCVGIDAIAGFDAGTLEVSVDGIPLGARKLHDGYCRQFHRPVFHLLAQGLSAGRHTLRLRIAERSDPDSTGHACRIVRFAVDGAPGDR